MYAVTVAVLAAVAVVTASATPTPQQLALVGDDFWGDCKRLLTTNNIALVPYSPLDIGKLTANDGLWYLAAYPKAWMNAIFGTDVGTPTCTNMTITTDIAQNVTTMSLNISPPIKTATTVYTLVNTLYPYQVLESASGGTISGISFLQLDDNNAALVGCTLGPAPATATYFWNILTRNEIGRADSNAIAKIVTEAIIVRDTIDIADAVSHSNEQCAKF